MSYESRTAVEASRGHEETDLRGWHRLELFSCLFLRGRTSVFCDRNVRVSALSNFTEKRQVDKLHEDPDEGLCGVCQNTIL